MPQLASLEMGFEEGLLWVEREAKFAEVHFFAVMIAIWEGGVVPGFCSVLPEFDGSYSLNFGGLFMLLSGISIHTFVFLV